MAYQARHRDPLFDSDTQAIIERRGKELIGILLLGLGVLSLLALWSYSADDPNWLSSTDRPAQNILGPIGAAFASPLYVIAGYGSWAIALTLLVWGGRLTLHYGTENILGRAVFAPIAVALVSVYCSTLVPGASWPHSFGLGGLFGDTVLGAVLGLLPVPAGLGLKVMSLVLAVSAIAMMIYVLGFDRDELWVYSRYLLGGLILLYHTLMSGLGRGATGTWRMAANAKVRRVEARAAEPEISHDRGEVSTAVLRATRPYVQDEPEKGGLQSLLPSILKRRAPEPVTYSVPEFDEDDERISARISDAVQKRVRRPKVRSMPVVSEESPVPSIAMLDEDGEIAELRALDEQMAWPETELENPAAPRWLMPWRRNRTSSCWTSRQTISIFRPSNGSRMNCETHGLPWCS